MEEAEGDATALLVGSQSSKLVQQTMVILMQHLLQVAPASPLARAWSSAAKSWATDASTADPNAGKSRANA